jgi:AraC family transcriptional regulator
MGSLPIVIEPRFSLERRTVVQRALELPVQSGYLLLYFLQSRIEGIASGATLLVNPHQKVSLAASCGGSDLLLVRLAPELLLEMATRLRLGRQGVNLLFRQPLSPITDDRQLSNTLESLNRELVEGEAGWREVIGSLVSQLAIYLLRTHINVQRSDELELSRVGIVDRRLRRAVEYMHDHCDRELSLPEIARVAYLSAFHFARLFKKLTGTTPHAYLASLRIERARRMLAETDLPIAEIGSRVGYGSQSHFTKLFREATGLTPKAFRQAAQSR